MIVETPYRAVTSANTKEFSFKIENNLIHPAFRNLVHTGFVP